MTLQGRYRKVVGGGTGDPAYDSNLGTGVRIRDGQYKFVLTHFLLDEDSTYLIRVADDFTNDPKSLASRFIRTRRGIVKASESAPEDLP
jgi:hypothetical protein